MSGNSKGMSRIAKKGLKYYTENRVKQTFANSQRLTFQVLGKKPYKAIYHKEHKLYQCNCQEEWKGIQIERNPFCSHCFAMNFWMKNGGVI